MVNVIFNMGDADFKNEITERLVTRAVYQYKVAIGTEHTVHFTYSSVFMWIMMEGITAGNHVEGITLKGQVFGIADG